MRNKLPLGEKIFCETMSLLLAGWWLFLTYLVRDYLVYGFLIVVGMAIVVALFEQIGEEKHGEEAN